MVYVHLANGVEEIEAVTIVDVLRRGGIEVETVSVTGSREVTGRSDITLVADLLYEDADYKKCDMIVLPGGIPGTPNLARHEGLIRHIQCFAEDENKMLAAICAAPQIFGELGILKGKKATIYPGLQHHLKGADYSTDRVVIDGRFITSAGPGTAMEFAVALVEILAGKQTADSVKSGLLFNE